MKQLKKQTLEVVCGGYNRNDSSRSQVATAQGLLNGFMRNGLMLAAAVVALVAMTLSIPAYAGSVFSQPPSGTGTTQFSYDDAAAMDMGYVFYDNFTTSPTQAGSISNITWQGQDNPNSGFTIIILGAQPATPDAAGSTQIIKTINVPDNSSRSLTANAKGLYDYYVNLAAPFVLQANKSYWITIYATGPGVSGSVQPWGWGDGSGLGSTIQFQPAGAPPAGNRFSGPTTMHRTFSLNDTAVTANLVSGEVNLVYSSALSGVSTANSLAVSGTVPPGLKVDLATGILSGTPTAPGAYTFIVIGNAIDDIFNITINSPVAISTVSLPNGTVGAAYISPIISATGGATPYGWSLAGTLPAGLTYDNQASILSGKPGAAGVFNLIFTATDTLNATSHQPMTLTIAAAPVVVIPVTISTASLTATENIFTSTSLSATGGTGPYNWSVSGALPANLTLLPNGLLSGTPAIGTAGTYNLTFTATDSKGAVGSKALVLAIAAAPVAVTPVTISTASLTATENVSTSIPLSATGGAGPYTWTVSGALPAKMSFVNGVLSGTPAIGTAGTSNLIFTAKDSKGAVGTKALTLTIAAAAAPVTPVTPLITPVSGDSNSKLCTLVNNVLNKFPMVNGSDKIALVGKNYIKLKNGAMLNFTGCSTVNFTAPATNFVVGETAAWTGHSIFGFTEAASITVSK